MVTTLIWSFSKKFLLRLFVNLCPWYYVAIYVCKVLVDGREVIEKVLLSIGQLSKAAQEARNMHIKMGSSDFSRKFLRVKIMEDVFNRLLVSSVPYISKEKNKTNFTKRMAYSQCFSK